MNLPFFASFIIFGIWLTYELHKSGRKSEKAKEDFWEKECEANMTRRKPLDDLVYVTPDFNTLPFGLMPDNEAAADCERLVLTFRDKKAVNLTGITNTELKLTYGAANINTLTAYDQNYTQLIRALQKWAELLLAAGFGDEAVSLMEFCVETHSDISATYKQLAAIYKKNHEDEKIDHLRDIARTLNSAMKNSILKCLEA